MLIDFWYIPGKYLVYSMYIPMFECGEGCVPVSLVIYIDGSFLKHGVPVNIIPIC